MCSAGSRVILSTLCVCSHATGSVLGLSPWVCTREGSFSDKLDFRWLCPAHKQLCTEYGAVSGFVFSPCGAQMGKRWSGRERGRPHRPFHQQPQGAPFDICILVLTFLLLLQWLFAGTFQMNSVALASLNNGQAAAITLENKVVQSVPDVKDYKWVELKDDGKTWLAESVAITATASPVIWR